MGKAARPYVKQSWWTSSTCGRTEHSEQFVSRRISSEHFMRRSAPRSSVGTTRWYHCARSSEYHLPPVMVHTRGRHYYLKDVRPRRRFTINKGRFKPQNTPDIFEHYPLHDWENRKFDSSCKSSLPCGRSLRKHST